MKVHKTDCPIHAIQNVLYMTLAKSAPFGSSPFTKSDCSIHAFQGVLSEIFGACSVDRSWGGRKRRFCLQIEVPAAVVSHVLKIGLNWSKWANLGGKETWRRADSILGISEHHATSQQWSWRGCKCVRNIRTMLKMVKNGHHCGPRWPRPSFRKSLSLRFKHQSYPPNTHCLL